MLKKSLRLLAALLALVAVEGARALTIDESVVDFGEQYQFAEITHDVRVWNETLLPIRLSTTATGLVRLTFDDASLEPGKSTLAHIKLSLANHSGVLTARVSINGESAGKTETREITVTGFVNSVLDDSRPALDLGVVDANGPHVEKPLSLLDSDDPDLRIVKVLEEPEFLSTRIGDAHTLHIKPSKIDALGYNKGVVKVALNSKLQSQAWITVLMDAHGDVVPDQNPVDFGLQRPGSRHPVRLQLNSRSGQAFRIGEVDAGAAHVSVERTECLQAGKSCQAFLLMIDPKHAFGQVTGKIAFPLPETHQVLNVHLGGVYLADNTRVVSLDKPEPNGETKTDAPQNVSLAESLKRATGEKQEFVLPGTGPLLKWQVANEAGIYGYAIYRGDSADGKFARVNDAIVKADNGGDGTTANYQWRDTAAQKGHEYWYYITIFNNNGTKTQLTGPQKVVAK